MAWSIPIIVLVWCTPNAGANPITTSSGLWSGTKSPTSVITNLLTSSSGTGLATGAGASALTSSLAGAASCVIPSCAISFITSSITLLKTFSSIAIIYHLSFNNPLDS